VDEESRKAISYPISPFLKSANLLNGQELISSHINNIHIFLSRSKLSNQDSIARIFPARGKLFTLGKFE